MSVHVDEALEVNGAYLLGIFGSRSDRAIAVTRSEYGFDEVKPDEWYSAQRVIDFYNAIERQPGGGFDLVAIGKQIIANLEYPPQVQGLAAALELAQAMHYAGWRHGDPGRLDITYLEERLVRLTFHNLPLPVDLVYGMCYGLLDRFTPGMTRINVQSTVIDDRYIYDLRW